MLGQFWLKGLKRAWTFVGGEVVGGALFIIHIDIHAHSSIDHTHLQQKCPSLFTPPNTHFPSQPNHHYSLQEIVRRWILYRHSSCLLRGGIEYLETPIEILVQF